MKVDRALKLIALALPFAAAPLFSRAAADGLAREASIDLVDTGDSLRPEPTVIAMPLTGALGIGDEAPIVLPYYEPSLAPEPRAHPPAAGRPRPVGGPAPVAPRGGILVRSELVLRAVEAGARPSGTPVPASRRRPAGMALSGVSAGLRDGDVLTEIAGVPATSEGAVVGAIVGAVEARAPVITGTIWRGGEPLALAVEIPHPRRSSRNQAAKPGPGGKQR